MCQTSQQVTLADTSGTTDPKNTGLSVFQYLFHLVNLLETPNERRGIVPDFLLVIGGGGCCLCPIFEAEQAAKLY